MPVFLFSFQSFFRAGSCLESGGGSLACGGLRRGGHDEAAAVDPSDEARPFVSGRIHHDVSRARASRSAPLARLDVASKLLGDEAAQTSRAAESGRRDAASTVVPARAQGCEKVGKTKDGSCKPKTTPKGSSQCLSQAHSTKIQCPFTLRRRMTG